VEFIYASSTSLALDSIVQPGNYGENVSAHRPGVTDGWVLAREMIFENVRLRIAPQQPSRLRANFLFTSTAAALALKKDLENGILASRLYRVELIDDTMPFCFADYDALRQIVSSDFCGSTLQAAMAYWIGTTKDIGPWSDRAHEFLTYSPIKILRQVSGGNPFELHCPTISVTQGIGD